MAENETMEFNDLVSINLGTTGEALKDLELGSESRVAEAKIFESQAKLALDEYAKTNAIIQEDNKLSFEREKFEAELALREELEREKIANDLIKHENELALKREMEEARLAIEQDKAKTEKHTSWAKIGLLAAEIGATVGSGIVVLKANMKWGGLMGKDAQGIFREIRKIKLW